MKREEVLMEALPYIQRFHGKTIVIKLGGHAMVDQEILEMAIRDAVLLQYDWQVVFETPGMFNNVEARYFGMPE